MSERGTGAGAHAESSAAAMTSSSYGEMDDPMLGIHGRTVKHLTRFVNDDKHIFEIFDLAAGDDYKVIEITYTRKR